MQILLQYLNNIFVKLLWNLPTNFPPCTSMEFFLFFLECDRNILYKLISITREDFGSTQLFLAVFSSYWDKFVFYFFCHMFVIAEFTHTSTTTSLSHPHHPTITAQSSTLSTRLILPLIPDLFFMSFEHILLASIKLYKMCTSILQQTRHVYFSLGTNIIHVNFFF